MVLNVSSGAHGNRSEIVRILVLAMTTAGTAKKILNIYICTKNETDLVNVLKVCQTGRNKTALSRG